MGWYKQALGGGIGYAVAGPGGALLGIALASGDDDGYDMSDIPVGAHVEEEHQDDEAGRRWTLRFLSEVPAAAFARVSLVTDAGQKLLGRAPFVEQSGGFFVAGPIVKRTCVVYVPFAAIEYESAKYVSLEVVVWGEENGKAAPVGKATLDANLPRPQSWDLAELLQPVVAMCVRVMRAESEPADDAVVAMVDHIVEAFDMSGAGFEDIRASLVDHARRPMKLSDAASGARFRFPGIPTPAFVELISAACFGEDEGTKPQRDTLANITALL